MLKRGYKFSHFNENLDYLRNIPSFLVKSVFLLTCKFFTFNLRPNPRFSSAYFCHNCCPKISVKKYLGLLLEDLAWWFECHTNGKTDLREALHALFTVNFSQQVAAPIQIKTSSHHSAQSQLIRKRVMTAASIFIFTSQHVTRSET